MVRSTLGQNPGCVYVTSSLRCMCMHKVHKMPYVCMRGLHGAQVQQQAHDKRVPAALQATWWRRC